jgi:murein DD-endopeptidase MepM/ murein hydrolase activator NlpD
VVDDSITASGRTTERPDTATGEDVISNPVLPNATGFANPLGDAQYTVTSGFGSRRSPTAGASTNHGGVDLAGVPAGTPVYAAKGGNVIISGDVSGYGNAVYIDHGDGTQTRYGHMQDDSLPFTPGQPVVAGQRIGRVGNTGRGTGAHLHYEIRTGRSGDASNDATTPLDPRPYLGTGG